jgi:hypothetical protein
MCSARRIAVHETDAASSNDFQSPTAAMRIQLPGSPTAVRGSETTAMRIRSRVM